ncbi:MAG: type IA DNA topoisomerase [Clostridiales bacterium]|uniref:type IA DNA topoisomerase n=1 Tax=Clostridium sp. N3C TaxID=1776758 RepID=UPI00092E1768|nr:DNA topoisomerase [Clostridium sp. N3C]NLZ47704.1 type IA DNA topoisomerase [Clostridiales bacterium]SCN25793.1 DNA topoisomerase 3 [Clostridium sp. N3C]
MKKLILAEKPSVGRNIAEALNCKQKKDGYLEGEEYIVTWAFGHLVTLCDCKDYDKKFALWNFEYFPYIPEKFRYKIKPNDKNKNKEDTGAKKQLMIIKALSERPDVESIIIATDYDREGELIALLIFSYIKTDKPRKRILINEWTPQEIKRGLENLKTNEEMKPLQDAGVSRQLADWVIGINFTSLATLKFARGKGSLLNIGRVLMPTLKMIYDREMEIKNFKSETNYELIVEFMAEGGSYKGRFFHGKNDKFPKKESVEKLKKEIEGKRGIIEEKKVEIKYEYSPSLFNLSNLQGHITSKYKGWTADKVLKVAQSLYEKKYITYPRTESTALEETIKDKAKNVLETLKADLPFKDEIKFNDSKKVFNNAKVESHSAIMPTYIKPKNLSQDEAIVYDEVKNRFISQFMEPAEYENTEVITKVKGENYDRLFITKGKILKRKGWLKLYKEDKKDELLPPLEKDEEVDIVKADVVTKKTKPPAHHTEKTLLKAMETCGKNRGDKEDDDDSILYGYSIGTAATRAETINKLKTAGYIYAKGKSLLITDVGIKLIENFPVKEIMDTDYTGKLEKKLFDMEKGKYKKEDFLREIYNFTINGAKKIKFCKSIIINDKREKDKVNAN